MKIVFKELGVDKVLFVQFAQKYKNCFPNKLSRIKDKSKIKESYPQKKALFFKNFDLYTNLSTLSTINDHFCSRIENNKKRKNVLAFVIVLQKIKTYACKIIFGQCSGQKDKNF